MTDLDLARPVLVAGASGFVGTHVTRLLVARGRAVRILLRKTSNQRAFEGLPVEIVYGDVLEPDTLRTAMQGCASVFYCVVDPRFWLTDQTPIFRNNVEGLSNAVDAALDCGIQRFIFTSTMGTLGIDQEKPVTEDVPFNWLDVAPPYIEARLEAENRLLAACRQRGLPGVALCVANTYGPQDYQPTPHNGMLWQVASGKVTTVVDAAQPTVDIRDVAEAALLAEAHGRVGERYIIANEYVGARAFYGMAVAQTGRKMPKVVSYRTAFATTWLMERVMKALRRRDFMANTDGLRMMRLFGPLDNGKARRELGWTPRPLSQTIADGVAWFSAQVG